MNGGWVVEGEGIIVDHVEVSFLGRGRELKLLGEVMSLLLCGLKGLGRGHGVSLVAYCTHGRRKNFAGGGVRLCVNCELMGWSVMSYGLFGGDNGI